MHTTPEQCCGSGSVLKGGIRIRIPIKVMSCAYIQRWGSILAWIVILSVYDAETIDIDISLSALIS
jgi:hypothetical protein